MAFQIGIADLNRIQLDPTRARALAAVYRLLAELGRRTRQQQVETIQVDGEHGVVTVGRELEARSIVRREEASSG
jgi:hypothetical protein